MGLKSNRPIRWYLILGILSFLGSTTLLSNYVSIDGRAKSAETKAKEVDPTHGAVHAALLDFQGGHVGQIERSTGIEIRNLSPEEEKSLARHANVTISDPQRLAVVREESSKGDAKVVTEDTASASRIHQVPRMQPSTSQKKAYEVDFFCPRCASSSIAPGVRCGDRINRYIQNKKMTKLAASQLVAKEFPRQCGRCDPASCSEEEKIYWRLDSVAPRIISATTHYLNSIPDQYRVPRAALSDLDVFFSKKENVSPQRQYLFEYNPSIVQIPNNQIPRIEGESPIYLASYRVSNMQQCITGEHELQMIGGSWPRPKQVDYAGIALLRSDLTIIQDTVVDFRKAGGNIVEDFRIFVLNDNLYVSSFDFIFPIWLVEPVDAKDTVILNQRFPSNMQIFGRSYKSCVPFHEKGTSAGKNMSFFVDKKSGKPMAEQYPMGAKRPVDLLGKCYPSMAGSSPRVPPALLPTSFATADELHFSRQQIFDPPYTSERGSTCCVSIQDPNGRELLVGISHSKTRFKSKETRNGRKGNVAANEFFSSFYAMEPTEPYTVVARTGRFCFGFSSPEEVKSNPFALSNMEPLQIGESYDCPRIHFVSGMVEKYEDPSKVIVAYGVNDCAPRLVEILKKDISDMLFPEVKPNLDRSKSTVVNTDVDRTGVQTDQAFPTDHLLSLSKSGSESLYEIDSFCPRCLSSTIAPGVKCGDRIRRHAQSSNTTQESAARFVANEFPKHCGTCDPKSCSEEEKRYWRVDAIAPRVISAKTHYLTSVSDDFRVPRSALTDLDSFFSEKKNVFPQRQYLFEYNPSIVQLPHSQIPQIDGESPVYLASYRVSNTQQCITGKHELEMIGGSWPRPPATEYAGFALLRSDLSIIRDTVVDFKRAGGNRVEDFRIFVLNESLYVSSYDFIFPIWLVEPHDEEYKVTLTQRFPSDMELFSRSYKSCVPFHDNSGKRGKNMNFFVDRESGQPMVERYPMGEKAPVDLTTKCIPRQAEPSRNMISELPSPSFVTSDELHFNRQEVYDPPYTSERGGSCCVPFQDQHGKELLLGISHSKTRFKAKEKRNDLKGNVAANEFFSSFYVMEPTAPYRVIARTGRFCFGFSSPEEVASNPFALSNTEPLQIGQTYDCPRIHFVSGMAEKSDDPSKVIVAYGINDCVPRMVEVSKTSISEMLFPRPKKNVD